MSKHDTQNVLPHANEVSEPEFLYKYRALNSQNQKWIERLFTHNELYFPSPAQFNDPFDCRVQASCVASDAEYRKYLMGLYKRQQPIWNRARRQAEVARVLKERRHKDPVVHQGIINGIQDNVNKAGVYCLSERPDHILMWSHYSEGHKGFCLQFRVTTEKSFFVRALKVKYQRPYPQLHLLRNSADDFVESILLTKAHFWEYEREWRIIENRRGSGVYTFPEELLTGVIFGCLMPEQLKQKIRNWIQQRRIIPNFYQAKRKDTEFGLDLEPID